MIYDKSRVVTDDQDIGFHIYDLKPMEGGSATIAVAAGGTITLIKNSTTYTIDCSLAAYNTFGEVIDYINGIKNSDGERLFNAVLIDSLRSDSSNDTLLLLSTTSISPSGLGICKDTSVALNLGVGLTMQGRNQTDINIENVLKQITSLNTYGAGTNTILVYFCPDHDTSKSASLIGQWAGGATTVEQILPNAAVLFEDYKVQSGRLLVQMVGSGACTGRLGVIGLSKSVLSN